MRLELLCGLAMEVLIGASSAAADPVWIKHCAVGPEARDGAAMVFDTTRGVSVLFGGERFTGPCCGFGDTWEWDGRTWTQRLSDGPSMRTFHAMAYDSHRGVTVLFGGDFYDRDAGTVTYYDETWEWDGTTWVMRNVIGPAARAGHALAFDSTRNVTVLFGGADGAGTWLSDTWEWDGSAWVLRALSGAPTNGLNGIAFDSARGVTTLFSAFDGSTWEWDGIDWIQRASTGPATRWGVCMAYDPTRGVTVLQGGCCYFDDTWEWNGATWQQTVDICRYCWDRQPSPRHLYGMTFDGHRSECVLFGGRGYHWEADVLGDTWTYREGPRPGDLNCDGSVNTFDIQPFIVALTDEQTYADSYPNCSILAGDVSDDGTVNQFDIQPFIKRLARGCW